MFKIAGYIVDLEVTAEVTYDADLAEYPAETGSAFHDLLSNQPPVLSIEFLVSDSPIGEVAKARQGNVIPSSEAKSFLEALRDSLEPFTIECSLGTFESMVFAPLAFKRDSDTGAALAGSATFKKAVIRQLRRVVIEQTAAPARRNLGNRPTSDVAAHFFLQGPGRDPPYTQRDEVEFQTGAGGHKGHWRFVGGDGARLSAEQEDRLLYQYTQRDLQFSTNPDGSKSWRTVRTSTLPGAEGTTIERSNSPIGNVRVVPDPPSTPAPVREPLERGNRI